MAEEPTDLEPDPAGSLSLDEALSLVGEETRARIVIELGEAVRSDGVSVAALSFSELMDRVGVEDSGRFNYHLDKLVGTFVRKVDGKYVLGPPGHFFYRAVVAGTLTARERRDPVDVDECPECGETLTAEYSADHCLHVRCRACGASLHGLYLPSKGTENRSWESILDTATRKGHHEIGLLRDGICHACSADVERDLRTDSPYVCSGRCNHDAYAVFSCSVCNVGGVDHPATVALTTPPVVGFFADHGRDARAERPWETPVAEARAGSEVVSENPLSVEVPFELGDERLTVVLDDELQVAETERAVS